MELPFQPSEVATSSSQLAAAASSRSNEPDVDTCLPIADQSGHIEQDMEKI